VENSFRAKHALGINGLGRMGKLTLWHHLHRSEFDGFVLNVGRPVGRSLGDVTHTIDRDSTYGTLGRFLHGCGSQHKAIRIVDESAGLLEIEGKPVKILREARDPRDIAWAAENARIVIDCTGAFKDPTHPTDHPGGSVRGHLEAGAEKVVVSAPFKIKDSSRKQPADCQTLVFGINHMAFQPEQHHILSAASCTTTGLAHMMKPLVDDEGTCRILTASMSTVHAATSTQSILDTVPKAGATDLRKNRSVFNNIILTSTGAAKTLEKILPEIQQVGFMADSVRIPTNTVSLITLNITFLTRLTDQGEPLINRKYLNDIYRKAADGPHKGLLEFSERQNVSSDLMGRNAAVVIEGVETHTRTGFVNLSGALLRDFGLPEANDIRLPVTHAKIFGWYDNEYGSYVTSLARLVGHIASTMW
jgi:glyceraldehyde-3-phosphate dehydrogenase type I